MCMCILRVIAGSLSPAAAQSATRQAHAHGAAARGTAWRVSRAREADAFTRTASARTKHEGRDVVCGHWSII